MILSRTSSFHVTTEYHTNHKLPIDPSSHKDNTSSIRLRVPITDKRDEMKNPIRNASSHHGDVLREGNIKRRLAIVCLAGVLCFHPTNTHALVRPNLHLARNEKKLEVRAASRAPDELNVGSKRVRLLNKIGFKRLRKDGKEIREAKSNHRHIPGTKFDIKSVAELNAYFDDEANRFRDKKGEIDYDDLLKSLSVEGDTQIIGSPDHPDYVHPVAKLLHERKRKNSTCVEGPREDGCKVALVVEGGGMRGCVSAGMVCALHHLGLRETVDVVYGSSAGSIVGAYFITEQLPWFGPEVYYDKLTTAGREFIDTSRLLRSLGLGLANPRLLKDVLIRRNNGKPILNLPFLLKKTMLETQPLDWDTLTKRRKVQPLKVVASALKSEKPMIMDMENGHFKSLEELSNCMHASCLLPGIAGPVMNIKVTGNDDEKPKFVIRNNLKDPDYEPLGDALIYAPMPYDIAQKDGATHTIVIRSRPDGIDVTGKGGVFERLIFKRFFMRKNKLPGAFKRMASQLHKKLYAKNVIELNEASYSNRDYKDTSQPHRLTLALRPGSDEVTRLETGREAIFEGVRRGFARAYDALVEDPSERGRGHIVAQQYFPDEILDYDPLDVKSNRKSAFQIYMEENEISPKAWDETFAHASR